MSDSTESLALWFCTGTVLLTSRGLWTAQVNPDLNSAADFSQSLQSAPVKPTGAAPCGCIMTLKHICSLTSHSLTRGVAVVPAGGSLPICAACKQRIYDEQYLQALNSDWHAICFRYVVQMNDSCKNVCLFSNIRISTAGGLFGFTSQRFCFGKKGQVYVSDFTLCMSHIATDLMM